MQSRDRLKKLYEQVYLHPRVASAIRAIGFGSVWFVVAGFTTVGVSLILDGRYFEWLNLIVAAAIPFAVVSIVRIFFNFERPYEVIDLEAFNYMKEERKSGRSFPSRHVFSAFLIGVLILKYSAFLGALTLCIGLLLGACRVALGIHFPKDVIAGEIIGIVSGVVGLLIL